MFIAELQKEKYKVEENKIFLGFCRVEEFDLQISDFYFWQFYSNKFNIIVSEPFLELYSLKNTHSSTVTFCHIAYRDDRL